MYAMRRLSLIILYVTCGLKLRNSTVAEALENDDTKLTVTRSTCGEMKNMSTSLPGNLFYVKVSKTGGTTLSGVLRRIGCKHGIWLNDVFAYHEGTLPDKKLISSCPAGSFMYVDHSSVRKMQQFIESCQPLTISMIRSPIERCMSWIYHFKIMRENIGGESPKVLDDIKMTALEKEPACHDGMSKVLQTKPGQSAEDILSGLSFVGITERYQESLVVLAHQWGLPLTDVVYIRAKDSGRAPTDPHDIKRGYKPVEHLKLEEESPQVQDFAKGAKFRELNSRDFPLYELANKQLDKQSKEVPDFKQKVARLEEMLKMVDEQCQEEQGTSCYTRDQGCAQACIKKLSEDNKWED